MNSRNPNSKIESGTQDLMRATMYNPQTCNLTVTQEQQTLEDEDTCLVFINEPVTNINSTPVSLD